VFWVHDVSKCIHESVLLYDIIDLVNDHGDEVGYNSQTVFRADELFNEFEFVQTAVTDENVSPSNQTHSEGEKPTAEQLPEIISTPNQPKMLFPSKTYARKERRFKHEYFSKYPWLHWNNRNEVVFCYICRNVTALGFRLMYGKDEIAFDVKGFSNWKEPLTDFKNHEESAKHREFTSRWIHHTKGKNIDTRLIEQVKEYQKINREALHAVGLITSLQYLAQQGLSL